MGTRVRKFGTASPSCATDRLCETLNSVYHAGYGKRVPRHGTPALLTVQASPETSSGALEISHVFSQIVDVENSRSLPP